MKPETQINAFQHLIVILIVLFGLLIGIKEIGSAIKDQAERNAQAIQTPDKGFRSTERARGRAER